MTATVEQLRILLAVLTPFACLVTYTRLYFRFARGRFWWDDFWAFVATLCGIVFLAASLLLLKDPGSLPRHTKIAVYYLCAQFFYAVVWTVRISMMFTVIRLSIFGKLRQMFFLMVFVFFGVWAILFAQVWWVCERQTGWKDQPIPMCGLGSRVAIAQVFTDVVTGLILVLASLALIWRVELQPGTRLRLQAVFASTSLGTAVSLYHAYCVLRYGGIPEFTAAIVQLTVTLIVVNLPALVAVIFRVKSDSDSDNLEPFSITVFNPSNRTKRDILSTFGASTMPTSQASETKLNVKIVRTTWIEDLDGYHGRQDSVSSTAKVLGEMKSFGSRDTLFSR
ncbi:hypothetical protein R3P38DRAFT_61350 [Favolaschia claudopus]|uniref:Rhodopsin domain-containing protein n=1 Tax=Favolaschia claudopus TaxID=2862362 RepID=A0AAW0ELD8_9AGAR